MASSYNDYLHFLVTTMLYRAGVPTHFVGYHYVREAILITVSNLNNFATGSCMMYELYPAVAEKFNATHESVEKAIRYAIETAWSDNNLDSVNDLLGYKAFSKNFKPTNKQFVLELANKISLETRAFNRYNSKRIVENKLNLQR